MKHVVFVTMHTWLLNLPTLVAKSPEVLAPMQGCYSPSAAAGESAQAAAAEKAFPTGYIQS